MFDSERLKAMSVFALEQKLSIEDFIVLPNQDTYLLMQYTGLKDKNGKEIYEGDVILLGNDLAPINRQTNGQVVYSLDDFDNPCYCILSDECDYIPFYNTNDSSKIWYEVIGNIYENKELLNETSN